MARSARCAVLLGCCCVAMFVASAARAECGSLQQCIGISSDPGVAPAHSSDGLNHPAPTLDFGSQAAGTTSAARTILVAAVEGPAGTRATLDSISLAGANAADFRIVPGGTCTTGTATLLHDGNVVAQFANACSILVAFSPATVGVKNAEVQVQTAAIVRVAPLTGTGSPSLTGPVAGAATLQVAVNTSATLDMTPFITGTATGVGIVTAPAHGTASVNGTSITYTPVRDYFGPDTFTYAAFNNAGSSSPATVSVTVGGWPDPTANADVVGLLRAQAQTARRFARAQIGNFQGRMERLHRGPAPESPAAIRADEPVKVASAGAQPGLQNPWPDSLARTLLGASATRSLNLASAGNPASGSAGSTDATGLWMAGSVHFGTRDQTGESSSLRFSTDGVSAGIDRRFGDRLVLGMGLGYARDATAIGTDGSKSRARGASIAAYGSYQPGAGLFLDALIGYGELSHDSERFVAPANDFARGRRRSEQWFGSVAAGYEYRHEALLLSPYGRLDFARDRLKPYTESGAGLNALTYFEQTLPTLQFALGLRAESVHETGFGWALPRLRIEFRHDVKGERAASLAYADLPGSPIFSITPSTDRRSALLLGLGSDFVLRSGLRLGVDYQIQRLSGVDHSQALRVWLAKELDGRGFAPAAASAPLFSNPMRVEASIQWDDNISRASDGSDKLSDRVYGLNVGQSYFVPLGERMRLVASGFLSGDKFAHTPGLDRFSGGGQGELQYRAAGEFFTPIFGLLGRIAFDEYAGQLRSGHRYALGVTYRQALSDRIELFAALTGTGRNAENDVFDGKDYGARFNLDYALGRAGALYLGGEYRRGDTVSSMRPPAGYTPPAKAMAPDDAFGGNAFTAYRLEAKTTLWTLGYNLPLGARDSLDLSGRRVRSTATGAAGGGAGNSRYTATQLSLAYLMRF